MKIILAGDPATGKSSFLQRFVYDRFESNASETIGASYAIKRGFQASKSQPARDIHFWDTAGQERYRALLPLYYRRSTGVLLFGDLPTASVAALKSWIDEIRLYAPELTPIAIVFSKSDLFPKKSESEDSLASLRATFRADGVEVFIASAKSGTGIAEPIAWLQRTATPAEHRGIDPAAPTSNPRRFEAFWRCFV